MGHEFLSKIFACQVPSTYIIVRQVILLKHVRNSCFGRGWLSSKSSIFPAGSNWTGIVYLVTHCIGCSCDLYKNSNISKGQNWPGLPIKILFIKRLIGCLICLDFFPLCRRGFLESKIIWEAGCTKKQKKHEISFKCFCSVWWFTVKVICPWQTRRGRPSW